MARARRRVGRRLPVLALLWFQLAMLCAMPRALATPGDVLYVEAPGADLRAAPRATAPVVLRLEPGRKLIEFERRAAWVRVGIFGTRGREAWVHGSRVTRLFPGDRASSPPVVARGPGAVAPAVPIPQRDDAGAPRFRLQVSGTPAVRFAGTCDLVDGDGRSRRRTFSGLVPRGFEFTASAILCRVRKLDFHGRLRVALTRDGGLIARAGTRAPYRHVRVRSAGPWGAAAGLRGAIPTLKFTVPPEARGRMVPPLTGTIIPPLTGTIIPPLTGTMVPPLTGTIVPPLTGRRPPPLQAMP
jgi:hypothetical protein